MFSFDSFLQVTNSAEEMNAVQLRYHRTQFGGWRWPEHDLTHPLDAPRFAIYKQGGPKELPSSFARKDEL